MESLDVRQLVICNVQWCLLEVFGGSKVLKEVFGVCGGIMDVINDVDVEIRFSLIFSQYL